MKEVFAAPKACVLNLLTRLATKTVELHLNKIMSKYRELTLIRNTGCGIEIVPNWQTVYLSEHCCIVVIFFTK